MAFGTLVLIGSGLKLPGSAAAAESMAGRSLASRILNAPIGSTLVGGARAAATSLGRAIISNPRVAALVARLESVQIRMAALENRLAQSGIGSSGAARAASKRYYERVRERLFQQRPNVPLRNSAFPRNTETDEFHHWLIPQRVTWAPNWLKHSRLNLMRVRGTLHARVDPLRWNLIKQPQKFTAEFAPYGVYGRLWYGTPVTVRAGAGGTLVIYVYVDSTR